MPLVITRIAPAHIARAVSLSDVNACLHTAQAMAYLLSHLFQTLFTLCMCCLSLLFAFAGCFTLSWLGCCSSSTPLAHTSCASGTRYA